MHFKKNMNKALIIQENHTILVFMNYRPQKNQRENRRRN